MPAPSLRAFLAEAPFALAMSSGFFSFFAHAGMLSVLEDESLVPVRVSGSSAGALVGGAWAAGLSASALGARFDELRRDAFWDPRPGAGLLAGKLLRAELDAMLPVSTFERCRVPFAASVFDLAGRRTEVITEGALAPAIHASCAVPFLFHPVWIRGRAYADGGIGDRPGLAGMPEGTRVLFHHIASRSPWRRLAPATMKLPARGGMVSLVMHGLPRSGPFRLEHGRAAFRSAQVGMRTALGREVSERSVVEVAVS